MSGRYTTTCVKPVNLAKTTSSSPDNDDDDDNDSYNVDIRCVLGTENLGRMPSGYLQGNQVSW